jgi:hypothetical protein
MKRRLCFDETADYEGCLRRSRFRPSRDTLIPTTPDLFLLWQHHFLSAVISPAALLLCYFPSGFPLSFGTLNSALSGLHFTLITATDAVIWMEITVNEKGAIKKRFGH